jgi:hypothetical protein
MMQLEASHCSAALPLPLPTVNQPKVKFITSDSRVNRRDIHMERDEEDVHKVEGITA